MNYVLLFILTPGFLLSFNAFGGEIAASIKAPLEKLGALAEKADESTLSKQLTIFSDYLAKNQEKVTDVMQHPEALQAVVDFHSCLETRLDLLKDEGKELKKRNRWKGRLHTVTYSKKRISAEKYEEATASINSHLQKHNGRLAELTKQKAENWKVCETFYKTAMQKSAVSKAGQSQSPANDR